MEWNNEMNNSLPKVLYKYRDWNNPLHKNILMDNKLYFASPKNFEDEYDCNVPMKYPSEKEWYNYLLCKVKRDNPNWSRGERRDYARKESKKMTLDLKAYFEKTKEKFNDIFGVLSMTIDCDNEKMWSKYACDNQGLCIGFDTKLLVNCGSGVGNINYVKDLPIINFIENSIEEKHIINILHKKEKWSFEKECRIYKQWLDGATENDRNVSLPNNCIVEIILGNNMSAESKEEVRLIAKEKYPNAKIIEK